MIVNIKGLAKFSVIILISFCSFLPALGQKSKADLEKQKKENLKKIEEAEKILAKTANRKEATLSELSALNAQIEASKELVSIINKEINLLDFEITEKGIIISSLQNDLEKLKVEYAKMVYSAYKANKGYSKLTFIFSAPTFNQLLRRLQWLDQYSEARKMQVKEIDKVKQELELQQATVRAKRAEQQQLLTEQLQQNEKLVALQNKQQSTVSQLAKRENQIKKEIDERRAALEQLETLIAKLVKEEIEKARREAEAEAATSKKKSVTTSTGPNSMPMTPEVAVLSTSFESARTKLLWPVSSGFISQKFGEHQIYKQVKLESQGVEIQTKENEQVRAVFDGQVKRVFYIPGMNNVVMIQHGQFFTVYARLKEVTVEPMQQVKAKDVLGKVYTNKDGVSELHFEIWKSNQKLDPEQWLYRN